MGGRRAGVGQRVRPGLGLGNGQVQATGLCGIGAQGALSGCVDVGSRARGGPWALGALSWTSCRTVIDCPQ